MANELKIQSAKTDSKLKLLFRECKRDLATGGLVTVFAFGGAFATSLPGEIKEAMKHPIKYTGAAAGVFVGTSALFYMLRKDD